MSNEEMAIREMERIHTTYEIIEMQKDIQEIDNILGQVYINMDNVLNKIIEINKKHIENIVIYNMIFSLNGKNCSLNEASDSNKINDLLWKRKYLEAKLMGKTFNELRRIVEYNFKE